MGVVRHPHTIAGHDPIGVGAERAERRVLGNNVFEPQRIHQPIATDRIQPNQRRLGDGAEKDLLGHLGYVQNLLIELPGKILPAK